jgi:hypothetical protein
MPVGLYADVHVPGPVILQLRLRDVDILAATEEQTNELPDHELLALTTSLGRVIVTQDIRFRVLAYEWLRTGRPSCRFDFCSSTLRGLWRNDPRPRTDR